MLVIWCQCKQNNCDCVETELHQIGEMTMVNAVCIFRDQPEAALAMITSFMTNNFRDDDFTMSKETIYSFREKDKEGPPFLALS